MKRLFLTFAILASISLTSMANTEIASSYDGGGKLPKELSLTQDQKEQVKKINSDFKQKIGAVKKSRIAPEMQQTKIKILRTEQQEAISQVLTPDQKSKLDEKKAKMMARKGYKKDKKQKRGDMLGGKKIKGAVWVLSGIEFTDQQKEQYKAIEDKYREESQAFEVKYIESRQELDDKYMGDVNELLTPEQQAVFKKNRESNNRDRHSKLGAPCPIMLDNVKLNDASKSKIEALKDTYEKEKSAVERSRIAPEMQKQKLQILKDKFEKEVQEIVDTEKK